MGRLSTLQNVHYQRFHCDSLVCDIIVLTDGLLCTRRTFAGCFQSTLRQRSSTCGVRGSSRNSALMLMVSVTLTHLSSCLSVYPAPCNTNPTQPTSHSINTVMESAIYIQEPIPKSCLTCSHSPAIHSAAIFFSCSIALLSWAQATPVCLVVVYTVAPSLSPSSSNVRQFSTGGRFSVRGPRLHKIVSRGN